MSGETLAELHGHTALVYSVAATETGLVASGEPVEQKPGMQSSSMADAGCWLVPS